MLFHGTGGALCFASLGSLGLAPYAEHVPAWLTLYLAATVLLVASTVVQSRSPRTAPSKFLMWAVVWAALIRVPLLATEPSLSDDIHRYVWEGRLVAGGLDPYEQAPDASELSDLASSSPEWEQINHRDLPAIYPAGAQWLFAGLASVRPDERLFRAFFILADLALIALLGLLLRSRKSRPEWLLLYAWHPLVATEVASSGHYEPLAMLPLIAGLLLWTRSRQAAAVACWGAAVALKFVGGFPALFAVAGLGLRERLGQRLGLALLLLGPYRSPLHPLQGLRLRIGIAVVVVGRRHWIIHN